jgi:UDP-3-O-[3-hydroxymyristoyl] N-acetylglucosamine deacetylase
MTYRRTLKQAVGCTGIGLHSGKSVRLELRPAPADHGIRFYRDDVGACIPAKIENLARLDHATSLSYDGVSVDTVEHLLSALQGLGVDDVAVHVDGPELPILDGSAAPFVILLHEAGLRPLGTRRRFLKVLKTVEVVRGNKSVRISPADHLSISYTIGFDHPLLRKQELQMRVTSESYVEDIAPARTFGFLHEVEMLRRAGLALGGSLENAVVIGESGVLNKLRFDDEFVRHKVLDLLGDMALIGHPIVAHIEAHRAGHAMHAAAAAKLLEDPTAWMLVAHPQLPVFAVPPVQPATPGLRLEPTS